MHTPKGARRVGGCSSDRRSGGDKPQGDGWWSECGERECLDLQTERQRENQSDRQGHSSHASFTPNKTPNEAADACVKV